MLDSHPIAFFSQTKGLRAQQKPIHESELMTLIIFCF